MTSAMLRKMELRHLRHFVAVAETLSFTKAEHNLHLAQPSLTRQERKLGIELNCHHVFGRGEGVFWFQFAKRKRTPTHEA